MQCALNITVNDLTSALVLIIVGAVMDGISQVQKAREKV